MFSKPQDRVCGQIPRMDRFRRVIARVNIPANSSVCRTAACAVAYHLIPHQLNIAHECRRHAPRVLLADEVGFRENHQAGMVAASATALWRC
ncbi:hypothetical protein ACNKHR_07775 [Shigella flexneri]